ncbi:NADH:flavin oxidoreductase/NADH oxidase family protein [Arenicella xantha]|uniref:2,4-dienoyl-CoA reductase-like NADH-dependent reductase (Old Yellow Enzyme family) n=1 Tax=Arenicella xantha TaxID=644221 RepID=A0A395JNC3_9GAMM|nr:NADH:flavin oxidoreductase/NADH oxidase family protein [Arenicella xantha]RBP51297.1 2,4-dienoyl-CoA reductase-like NADH-dependent reductase (Old Yellow Enzyme family) [Arenicella xantha]
MSAVNSLYSELTLPCGVTLANRFGKSAMTEGLADPHDNPTAELNRLYKTWSQGGTGLLISGNVMVDRRYLERAGNVVLDDDRAMAELQDWARCGTVQGNQLWMQINHPGRQCPRMVNNQPLAPSEVQLQILGNFSRPRAMSEDDIEDVIQRFATTAKLAQQGGFTGVQVHCAHGYLISQFLNPLVNKRNDQWGGSLENRARLARRIIQAVRAAVGPNFPVAAKLNSADFQKGGFSVEECIQVATWLAEDSLDLLEISGGNYEQLSLLGAEPQDVRDSTRKREAYFLDYAKAIKSAAKIPLMVTGGFRSSSVMQDALADGELDIVGLARPFCTQPDLVNQIQNESIAQVDTYESGLVLGRGFWGENSRSTLVKSINSFGQVGFYYWQIIRLARGQSVQTDLGVFRAFVKHMVNDFRLNLRRKRAR